MFDGAPVLVVAAHPDDEVLGCGGTLARLANGGLEVHILYIADGESSRFESENEQLPAPMGRRLAMAEKACGILGCQSMQALGLRDNRLDGYELLDIVKQIELLILKIKPGTLLTHHSGDVNIDHRITHDAVISACRPVPGHPVKRLLFFETPSSTEWRPVTSATAFNPDLFVDVSCFVARKQAALNEYKLEMREFPHPRSDLAINALMAWRGATVGVDAAEAFVLGRLLY